MINNGGKLFVIMLYLFHKGDNFYSLIAWSFDVSLSSFNLCLLDTCLC